MEWRPSHEILLKKWVQCCSLRHLMHDRTGSIYEWGHYIIGPVTVACSSIAAVAQFANIGTGDCGWSSFNITIVIFVLLSSVLSGLQTFFRFDSISTQHRCTASKYEILKRDMEEQLSLDVVNRISPLEFIKTCKTELNTLSELNLPIPSCVVNRYIKEVEDSIHSVFPSSLPLTAIPAIAPTVVEVGPIQVHSAPHTSLPIKKEQDEVGGDYQDEFIQRLQEDIQKRRTSIEKYQLDRFQQP